MYLRIRLTAIVELAPQTGYVHDDTGTTGLARRHERVPRDGPPVSQIAPLWIMI